MSSYERKIVHDLVAERGFTSESEGEGRDRHTGAARAARLDKAWQALVGRGAESA